MPDPYTGNPAGTFDVTAIPLPIDSDEPSGALFSAPLETLLDNDAILEARIGDDEDDLAEAKRAFAYMAELSATALATSGYVEINSSSVNEGFSTFTAGAGSELEFPDEDDFPDNDDRGIYLVTIDMYLTSANASDPAAAPFQITRYDASGPTETVLATMIAERQSGNTAHPFSLHGTLVVDMTGLAPGNSRLRIKNGGADVDISNTYSRISVVRVGRGSP
jgi:hypothetical protein